MRNKKLEQKNYELSRKIIEKAETMTATVVNIDSNIDIYY